jgi:hypothetical protein
MQKCVHAIKVLTATKNDDQVSFLAMAPVLDSVLSTYINTDPSTRATMLGYKQVETMIDQDKAVEGKTPKGDNIIVGKLFREEDSDLSDDEVRNVVSKSVGSVDLSNIAVHEGVPGQNGNTSCVSVAGSVCLSYEVRRGYTTFYVRGKDTDLNEDFHRRYVVVNWGDSRKSELVVLAVDDGEFIDIVEDESSFGRHVENAYKVSMDEDMDITIRATKLVEKTTFLAEDGEEDPDVEDLDLDPAEVAEMDLAIVAQESLGYENLYQTSEEAEVDGESMAALAGARDKGFLKVGGTVMMPEFEESVGVIQIESLFD